MMMLLLAHLALATAALGPCTNAPAYHALDFTLGTWTVADGEGHDIGTSTIREDLDGCVVIENWVAPDGTTRGRNLDAYNAEDQHWHRFFVDTRGHVHDFQGVTTGAEVQYEGTSTDPNGNPVRHRLTIRQDGANHLSQLWEKSSDAGKTWQPAFRGVFSRAVAQHQ